MTIENAKRMALAFQRYDWEQGVVAQAFLETGDIDTAIALVIAAVARQLPDGRCAQIGGTGSVTDPCAIGEALCVACQRDPALIQARDQLLHWALYDAPRNSEGLVYHLIDAPEFWVDSMYMLPPFLAKAGYVDEALRQLDGWWSALYLEEKGLLAHKWDDKRRQFIRPDAWGVGNGWALVGMTRVMPYVTHQDQPRLIERAHSLLDYILMYQMPDGRFHDVLDDPNTFPEVNCGQMVAYSIYRGVAEGWLEKKYIEKAELSRQAAWSEMDEYGMLRGVCGLPDFDRPGTAAEAQAFFILMEAAREGCKNCL